MMRPSFAIVIVAATLLAQASAPARAQAPTRACPPVLAGAERLILVTADSMNAAPARLQLFARGADRGWRAVTRPEPAVVGRAGVAWAPFYRHLARPGEPIKVEGDRRAPAGVFALGRSFGTVPSLRPGYLHVTPDTVCVDDPTSPAYNSITSRRRVGPKVSVENMSRMLPEYRRGIVVEYPTNAKVSAGSCIFLHVWRKPGAGTGGCIALPEARVAVLQDFAATGAAIAIMPRHGLDRLGGCLPGAAGAPPARTGRS